jgi:cytochrome c-type biogenesis protein CcmH
MNLFVIAALLLTILAVVTVIWPLLRTRGDGPSAPVAAVVLGLALPAAVVIIYLSVSNYDWSSSAPPPVPDNRVSADGMPSNIEEMVRQLENRLQTEPDDVEGWLMLGRIYARLQRVSESSRAYRRALALEPSSEAKLGVAEAEIILDRDNLTGEAGRLVEEVLVVEPQNPKALFYGGMVAMVRNDVDVFRDRWQLLLTLSPPDDVRVLIESQLAAVDGLPEESGPVEPGLAFSVSVSVSAGLADQVDPQAVLYLLARNPDRPGPPLAVVRHVASNLPATLTLSDANAMMPGVTLSSLPSLELVARISASGKPVAQPGDLFGATTWDAGEHSEQNISITIDRVVD